MKELLRVLRVIGTPNKEFVVWSDARVSVHHADGRDEWASDQDTARLWASFGKGREPTGTTPDETDMRTLLNLSRRPSVKTSHDLL